MQQLHRAIGFGCLVAVSFHVVSRSIESKRNDYYLEIDVSHMKLVDIKSVLKLSRTQIVRLKLVVTQSSQGVSMLFTFVKCEKIQKTCPRFKDISSDGSMHYSQNYNYGVVASVFMDR